MKSLKILAVVIAYALPMLILAECKVSFLPALMVIVLTAIAAKVERWAFK